MYYASYDLALPLVIASCSGSGFLRIARAIKSTEI